MFSIHIVSFEFEIPIISVFILINSINFCQLNPPHLVPLVEIIPAPWTDPEVISATRALLENVGQEPIVAKKETEGFIICRVQHAITAECFKLIRVRYYLFLFHLLLSLPWFIQFCLPSYHLWFVEFRCLLNSPSDASAMICPILLLWLRWFAKFRLFHELSKFAYSRLACNLSSLLTTLH